MSAFENRIPPPLLVMLLGLSMGLASLITRPLAAVVEVAPAVAFACFLLAGAFGLPAFRGFARAGTTIDPVRIDRASSLVTSGIYGLTRNPMYVALTLLLLAWAAWLARPVLLLGPLAFVLFIDRLQIRPEERLLTARFGAAYAAYRQRVRRWL